MIAFLRSLYFTRFFFMAVSAVAGLFVLAFFFPAVLFLVKILCGVLGLCVLVDLASVFQLKHGVEASRSLQEKLSNGSENPVFVYVENRYPFAISAQVIEELPFQFQKRDASFKVKVPQGETQVIEYLLRPVARGLYSFGVVNVLVNGPLGLVRKRYRCGQGQQVPVYPSFIQMRQYELLAASQQLSAMGIKRLRQVGHSAEFEQIRPYVAGDDQRTINWKASARKAELMVNHYQDEKSQQVYCVLDKGRVMEMPFQGLSLLDYAINAALVLSNVALRKEDKTGIITFADKTGSVLPAERRSSQLQKILELLYNQQTRFQESDFERLYVTVRAKVKQRSLLLLFTNFETLNGAKRQLPYLRKLAKHHLLLVVFFENTETKELLDQPANSLEEIYLKAIAEKFAYEKRQIVKEFSLHGIHSILTPPEKLTVNAINKYLEFKARGLM
ncbi:DUF58 domain-containing protein [Rufibacter quisquiliarum]|uniref:Uncharacterized protein (DUF58 family) n=1 Tax=Rufibacter quisquiliarum TaxID=1549639 RepID=A0A839GX36_9BACT|nr:DUF58 domain-containing protein [Rufibacter quisquiliarum]MBA9079306.1 uncharacterized protein (DUF58 family) [Rufibacter quisquiliarum]